MEALVLDDPVLVTSRLEALGLAEQTIREAVQYGVQHAWTCTRHDPPNLGGMLAWGKTVRHLRDQLVRQRWTISNARNYATVIHPDGLLSIAVAGGDAATGQVNASPATRTTKGPVTQRAVLINQLSFSDIDVAFRSRTETQTINHQTWILLHYIDEAAEEVRLELSLPAGMSEEGYVSSWRERIIMGPIAFAFEPRVMDHEIEQIDVPIERRA